MMPRKNKVGDVFGRLTIVSAYSSKTSGRWFHKVVCSCGKSKYVAGDDMRAGKVSSCGCLRTELFTTHGMSNSAEYKVWASMIQRCTNKGRAAYKNYGGRGISVCDDWLLFENFIEDMGDRKVDTLTIDRVDNNKGYCKANCVWADRSTQSINSRVRSDNKTGRKGVSVNRKGGYRATIQRSSKRVYLGDFKTLENAISARSKAENNFIKTGEL